jgi:hypothetical protein
MIHGKPVLQLGKVAATPRVLEVVSDDAIVAALHRHRAGDWGELEAEDVLRNNDALTHGGRVLSQYEHEGHDFWIVTEADRSVTTVLLPEDY